MIQLPVARIGSRKRNPGQWQINHTSQPLSGSPDCSSPGRQVYQLQQGNPEGLFICVSFPIQYSKLLIPPVPSRKIQETLERSSLQDHKLVTTGNRQRDDPDNLWIISSPHPFPNNVSVVIWSFAMKAATCILIQDLQWQLAIPEKCLPERAVKM